MTDTPSTGAATAAPAPKRSGWVWPDTRGWLAFAFVGLLMQALLLLAFRELPKDNRDLFVFLTGQVVGAGLMAIVNYYFGSSKGAADANARADKALDKLPEVKP